MSATSSQRTKSWKSLLLPYKSYLQAIHPAPESASANLKSRYWNLKATKNDFNWINGKPMPKIRADISEVVKRGLDALPIEAALVKRQSKEVVRANIVFDKIERGQRPTRGSFGISIKSDKDAKMLKSLLSIDSKWNAKFDQAREEYKQMTARDRNARARQLSNSTNKAVLDRIMLKDHSGSKFARMQSMLERLQGWLKDKGVFSVLNNHSYTYDDDFDITHLVFKPQQSTGKIRPVNYVRAGPAYNNKVSNCALAAIKDAMLPITDKETKVFDDLQTKYQMGVWSDDYEDIAKKLKITLNLTFAPSAKIAQHMEEANKIYGTQLRTIYLHHWSNHTTAMPKIPKHDYKFVSKDEMKTLLAERYEQLYSTGEFSLTFRDKSDGTFETVQLEDADGVKLTLGKTSPQSTLLEYYQRQIVPFSFNDPNREVYDMFAHHGIHFSTGLDAEDDIDLDLKSAYSNYFMLPNYKGLPRDITYWINDPTIEQVRSNVGKVLCSFTEPLSGETLSMWISTYEAELLYDNDYMHCMNQAAFAHNTFDLDLSKLVGAGINKRVFHKILGLSTATRSRKRFYTTDDIETQDVASGSIINLPECLKANDYEDELACTKAINATYPIQGDRYLHVAGVIQGLITCEIWRKYIEIKKSNPNAQVITALVDGLRFSSKGLDVNTINLDDGLWSIKPIRYVHNCPQFDWITKQHLHQRAPIASDEFIRINGPITVSGHYKSLLSVKKDNMLSFADLAEEGYINSLQGFAGVGKSYRVRQLLEQFNAVILTPTHSTREDMESYTIRDYLDDDLLTKIPVKTYQSVIQRAGSLRDYQVIIIDEAGMLLAEHLNRIIEMTQRKLILLVGDPAQHKPIKSDPMFLPAKYIMYKSYIESQEALIDIYNNGSDWERNNMLSQLRYDCTFVAPVVEGTEEERFDKIEAARVEYVNNMKRNTNTICAGLHDTYGDIHTARDADAFDCYTGGERLTEIKRADDTTDGKALIELCSAVREVGISAVFDLCAQHPEYKIASTDIYNNKDASIISIRNVDINAHNAEMLATFNVDKVAQKQINDELETIVGNEFSTKVEIEQATIRQEFNYPDVEISIVARETFVYAGQTIYNGTRGTMKNFVMTFNETSVPLTEIRTPTRVSKLNPFKRPTLFAPKVQPVYAITSYRAQGRTLTENIVVDCRVISEGMLYVAVSRAKRLSQLKFVLPKSIADVEVIRAKDDKSLPYNTADIKSGFKLSNASTVFAAPNVNLSLDLSTFAWAKYFDAATVEFEKRKAAYKIAATRNPQAKYPYYNDVYCDIVRAAIESMYPTSAKKQEDHTKDFKYLHSIGKPFFKLSDRKQTIRVYEMDYTGEEYTDVCDLQFVCRVEVNGIMGYYEFVDAKSMLDFNNQVAKDGYECHQINVDNDCAYFMDIDLKLHKRDLIKDIDNTNERVSALLMRAIDYTASRTLNYTISQRSRELSNDMVKISLHVYSNLGMSWTDAKQFTDELKQTIRIFVETDIDDNIADEFNGCYEDIIAAIDCAQYHKNGGLALPLGKKNDVSSTVIRSQILPLITVRDDDIEFSYEREEEHATTYAASSKSLIAAAMEHTENIDGYKSFDFTACRNNGPNGLRPRRCESSYCKCCGRAHDSDNTLLLTFSEEKRCAWYHCEKDDSRKFVVFYKE